MHIYGFYPRCHSRYIFPLRKESTNMVPWVAGGTVANPYFTHEQSYDACGRTTVATTHLRSGLKTRDTKNRRTGKYARGKTLLTRLLLCYFVSIRIHSLSSLIHCEELERNTHTRTSHAYMATTQEREKMERKATIHQGSSSSSSGGSKSKTSW